MKQPPDDLRGASQAGADAAAYPDVDALVAGAGRRVATRRRRLAVLGALTVAVVVLGGVAVTRPTHQALPQPAGKGASAPATRHATGSTASPTTALPASQSIADARAYGIDPAIAALPIGVRVLQLNPAERPVATTPEGLWLVSFPYASAGVDLVAHPQLTEYGELLLMTPDRSRILSAYPFRDVPPQWLLVTPQAVYCGRQGDGGVPNSMVCRVDRSTGALTVVVFLSPDDPSTDELDPGRGGLSAPQALAGRPGSWRLAGTTAESAFLQRVPRLTANGLLFAPDPNVPGGGKSLLLDPVTLK